MRGAADPDGCFVDVVRGVGAGQDSPGFLDEQVFAVAGVQCGEELGGVVGVGALGGGVGAVDVVGADQYGAADVGVQEVVVAAVLDADVVLVGCGGCGAPGFAVQPERRAGWGWGVAVGVEVREVAAEVEERLAQGGGGRHGGWLSCGA